MKSIGSRAGVRCWHRCHLFIYLLVSGLSLTGCGGQLASTSHEKIYTVQEISPALRAMSWPLRRKQYSQLVAFTVQGSLEVCTHNHKRINLIFRWKQSLGVYQLKLRNPINQGYIEIITDKTQARLWIQDKVYTANDAELLLKKHLGVRIPLRYLADWLKSMPQANARYERVLTPTQHLLTLNQAGWFIRYLRYHQIQYMDLPTQLCMMKGDWYVRILITHWEL